MIDEDIKLFYDALAENDEFLSERLRVLGALLQELDYVPRRREG